jgi:hypothetical protein
LAGAVLMALAGCTHRQATSVAYNPTVDFEHYRTYSWREGTPPPAKITDMEIMAGVERQLAVRGLRRVERGGDLVVTYHLTTEKSLDIKTYDYGTPYYGTYLYPTVPTTVIKEVKQGTLVVDLIDRRKNELVWRGIGTDRLPNNPASVARRVEDVTEKMFKQYPPRAPG